jgi:hypothetical protein
MRSSLSSDGVPCACAVFPLCTCGVQTVLLVDGPRGPDGKNDREYGEAERKALLDVSDGVWRTDLIAVLHTRMADVAKANPSAQAAVSELIAKSNAAVAEAKTKAAAAARPPHGGQGGSGGGGGMANSKR